MPRISQVLNNSICDRIWVFPENLGAVNNEQGESLHWDIRRMVSRILGSSNDDDYCWFLKRDLSPDKRKN